MVDHAGDVDRERVERLDRVAHRPLLRLPGVPAPGQFLALLFVGLARGAAQQVGQPAAAARGRHRRRRFSAARRLRRRGRRGLVRPRSLPLRRRFQPSAAHAREQRLFAIDAPRRLGRGGVDAAPVAGDDPVQFRQRLDLVDDHPAQLRRALGGLLRQLQDAAPQLLARAFEFVLHFAGHLPHGLQHVGEARGRAVQHGLRLARGLPEQRMRFVRRLLVDAVQGFRRALPLLFGRHADPLMMLGDGAGAL